jgi:hypothetical protein
VEFALHPLPKPPDSGDDGWSDEKEPGLALEEQQVESSSAGMLADFKVFTDATIAVLMQDPPPWPHSASHTSRHEREFAAFAAFAARRSSRPFSH